jgi:hypothetical protein
MKAEYTMAVGVDDDCECGGTDRAAGRIDLTYSHLFNAILRCELRPYLMDISTTVAVYLRGESISV